MKQGDAFPIPCHPVRSAGELEVLVRLVGRHVETETMESIGDGLGHGGVHRILVTQPGRAPSAVVESNGRRVMPECRNYNHREHRQPRARSDR